MRNLDLELLRTLVTVARAGTFSGAAEKLHKTQSAITQQMQRLESLIGLPLFEKQGRNKHLSNHGTRLVGYARHMLAINDEAVRALQDIQLEGVLRVGAPLDVADTILPTLLTHIARSTPRIKLEIRTERSPLLMDAMRAGELDLSISTRFDQAFEGVVLRTSPTAWICSGDYVHDPLVPVPLILADEPSIFRRFALAALEQSRTRWHINYLAPNLIGIKAAVRAGLGVTARSIELLGPDMRVLGEADGLPPLPDVPFFLLMRPDIINPLPRHVYTLLKTNMGLNEG
jgi:DNA-binding transcriptional LysR family regulator